MNKLSTSFNFSEDDEQQCLNRSMYEVMQPLCVFLHQKFAVHVSDELCSFHLVIGSSGCRTIDEKQISFETHGCLRARYLVGKDYKGASPWGMISESREIRCPQNPSSKQRKSVRCFL